MLCATVKCAHHQRQPAQRAAEQQQAHQEQQVIRSDQDVMDARRRRTASHRPRTLPGAGIETILFAMTIEDRLQDIARASRNVDERLVHADRRERASRRR
jgi:hypothetical protein